MRAETGPHLVISFHTVRENNWPPLPLWCPVKPCFYQDFSTEIPADYQRICKMLYYLWMCESSSCPFELKGKMECVSRVQAVLWLLLLGRLQPSAVLARLGGIIGSPQSVPCPENLPSRASQTKHQVGGSSWRLLSFFRARCRAPVPTDPWAPRYEDERLPVALLWVIQGQGKELLRERLHFPRISL